MLWIRIVAAVLVALVLGFLGLSLVFSDLGPGESTLTRTLVTVLTFLGGGFITGLIAGSRAWPLSILSAWGPILLGLVAMRFGIDRLFTLVLPPLLLSLLGGYLSMLVTRAVSHRKRPDAMSGGQAVGPPSSALNT